MNKELCDFANDILTLKTKLSDIRNDIIYPIYLDIQKSLKTNPTIEKVDEFKDISKDIYKCNSINKILAAIFDIITH